MNYQDPEPVVIEKKSYLAGLVTFLGAVVIIVVLYQGYNMYQIKNKPQTVVPLETSLASFGLAAPINTTIPASGTIYFGAAFASTSQSEPLEYTFNVTQKSFNLLIDDSIANAIPQSSSSIFAIISKDQFGASNSYQPYLLDKNTKRSTMLPNVSGHGVTDLTVSPDGNKYAYSYQTEEDTNAVEPQLLSHWHIAIHELNSKQVLQIDGGSEPEWVNNGSQLIYMGEKGLILYDIASGKSQLVFETYAPFTSFDDITVAPDSSQVVLTKANLSMISVLDYKQEPENTTLIEKGRIISEDTTYFDPVISPDSNYYVTNADKINNFNLNTEQMTYTYANSYALEIRQIDNATVLEALPLDGVGTSTVSISKWSSQ